MTTPLIPAIVARIRAKLTDDVLITRLYLTLVEIIEAPEEANAEVILHGITVGQLKAAGSFWDNIMIMGSISGDIVGDFVSSMHPVFALIADNDEEMGQLLTCCSDNPIALCEGVAAMLRQTYPNMKSDPDVLSGISRQLMMGMLQSLSTLLSDRGHADAVGAIEETTEDIIAAMREKRGSTLQ